MSTRYPLSTLDRAITLRADFIQINDTEIYKRCKVQLHAQGIVLRDIVSGAEIKTKRQQVCRVGEFLVAEIDAKVGGFGIVPVDLDGAIVSSHYFLFEINDELLNHRYLDFYGRTHAFQRQVSAQGSTNYAAIRPKDVLGYTIPLPPLAEQRRIVARSEELAAKIEAARGLRRETVEEAAVLLIAAEQIVSGISSENKWPLKPLEDICAVFIDCDHRTPEYVEQGVPLLRPRDVRRGHIDLSATVRIEPYEHEQRAARHRPVYGDIVYSRELSFGNAGMLPEGVEVSLGQGTMLMRARETVMVGEFLLYALNAPVIRDQAVKAAKGGAHPHVNLKDIRRFLIPVPPLPEQRGIVAYLDSVQAKVDAVKALQAETEAELNALLPAVLDRAFKGEL